MAYKKINGLSVGSTLKDHTRSNDSMLRNESEYCNRKIKRVDEKLTNNSNAERLQIDSRKTS